MSNRLIPTEIEPKQTGLVSSPSNHTPNSPASDTDYSTIERFLTEILFTLYRLTTTQTSSDVNQTNKQTNDGGDSPSLSLPIPPPKARPQAPPPRFHHRLPQDSPLRLPLDRRLRLRLPLAAIFLHRRLRRRPRRRREVHGLRQG